MSSNLKKARIVEKRDSDSSGSDSSDDDQQQQQQQKQKPVLIDNAHGHSHAGGAECGHDGGTSSSSAAKVPQSKLKTAMKFLLLFTMVPILFSMPFILRRAGEIVSENRALLFYTTGGGGGSNDVFISTTLTSNYTCNNFIISGSGNLNITWQSEDYEFTVTNQLNIFSSGNLHFLNTSLVINQLSINSTLSKLYINNSYNLNINTVNSSGFIYVENVTSISIGSSQSVNSTTIYNSNNIDNIEISSLSTTLLLLNNNISIQNLYQSSNSNNNLTIFTNYNVEINFNNMFLNTFIIINNSSTLNINNNKITSFDNSSIIVYGQLNIQSNITIPLISGVGNESIIIIGGGGNTISATNLTLDDGAILSCVSGTTIIGNIRIGNNSMLLVNNTNIEESFVVVGQLNLITLKSMLSLQINSVKNPNIPLLLVSSMYINDSSIVVSIVTDEVIKSTPFQYLLVNSSLDIDSQSFAPFHRAQVSYCDTDQKQLDHYSYEIKNAGYKLYLNINTISNDPMTSWKIVLIVLTLCIITVAIIVGTVLYFRNRKRRQQQIQYSTIINQPEEDNDNNDKDD
ncbi:hypothetical protein PPL_01086 [Heterostelium album PN500]|uniref:Transmembrane protein n=1 Tax=Heterostelium pallidum (strain ATCC 26659 / Pp 5 / PN500) TaxID=670386 RepID=D3AY27_HETP5|nr:hypothetical protein PPL_01086 [Heterostelium album PN500]EFA85854.1 hypothetical protein PPL_01086 [Heterostelium album PN500]|eukprot:XP_020437960.1 hypothetical protein PPL_01086 [Heterostelium album PN500]